MGNVHHCSGPTVSEMTYTVSSGMLNSSIPYTIDTHGRMELRELRVIGVLVVVNITHLW